MDDAEKTIEKPTEKTDDEAWKRFLRRHRNMVLAAAGIGAVAFAAALFVFLRVVADTQAAGIVPEGLGDWTVGYVIAFLLRLIFWELVLVGSWVAPIAIVAYFRWYKRLPEDERNELEGDTDHGGSSRDNVPSFFIGLIWLGIVWFDGRWNRAFAAWTFNEWIYSWVAAGLLFLLIVGIPGILYLLWMLTRKTA